MNQRVVRFFFWMALVLPAIFLVLAWQRDIWTYGQAVSKSGEWSAQLLIATLAVTPLRRLLGATAVTRFLVRRRRNLGVATFLYALLHTIIYVLQKADLGRITSEAQEFWLATGWAAMLALLVVAAISNDYFVRLLRQNWKRVQRLVYPVAILVFIHWTISAFDPLAAYLHLALLFVIEVIRFFPRKS